MQVVDNGMDIFEGLKKKLEKMQIICTTVMVTVLVALVASFWYSEFDFINKPIPYFITILVLCTLGTYRNKLYFVVNRGNIYLKIIENNDDFSVENIKEIASQQKKTKKILRFNREDAIANQANEDLKVLRKYGVIEFEDSELFDIEKITSEMMNK